MSVYYNDSNEQCCKVLRASIGDGTIYDGQVDCRDIRTVDAGELRDFSQWHLFAGIGGFPIGLKRAGFPINKRVLTGGFPCQDVSYVNTDGLGLDGDRSGLWFEQFRLIRDLRPDLVLVENVSALLGRGIGRVLGCLAGIGYDAQWGVLSACAFGFPHTRERLLIVSYPHGQRLQGRLLIGTGQRVQTFPEAAIWRDISTPYVCRGSDGIPARAHRLHALGNAIVPAKVEWIAERIKAQIETEKL